MQIHYLHWISNIMQQYALSHQIKLLYNIYCQHLYVSPRHQLQILVVTEWSQNVDSPSDKIKMVERDSPEGVLLMNYENCARNI